MTKVTRLPIRLKKKKKKQNKNSYELYLLKFGAGKKHFYSWYTQCPVLSYKDKYLQIL